MLKPVFQIFTTWCVYAVRLACEVASPSDDPGSGRSDAEERDPWWFMPSPQVAAVAVMALLTAGVVIGSVTSPLAQSAGTASIILEEIGEPEAAEPEPEPAAGSVAAVPEPTAIPSTAEAPLAPVEAPAAEPEPSSGPKLVPFEPEEEELLPEIKHVFLIVLEGHGYEEAFGEDSPAPYLAKTLAGEGKLLSNYYAVDPGRARQRDRPAQRPGADPADRRRLPRIHAGRAGHGERRKGRSKATAASIRPKPKRSPGSSPKPN